VGSGAMDAVEAHSKAVVQVKGQPDKTSSLVVQRLQILLNRRLEDAEAAQTDEPEKEVPKNNEGSAVEGNESECSQLISELDWPDEIVSLLRTALDVGSNERRRRQSLEATSPEDSGAVLSLANLQAKLTATRKSLKDREWTLAEARNRQQQLEDERARQDCRIRSLERALETSACSRSEAEQRHLTECLSADADAVEQRGELRRRLSSAEVERDKALAELVAAEQRSEESRKLSQRREEELQAQLAEAAREADELRQCLLETEEVEDTSSSKEAEEVQAVQERSLPSELEPVVTGHFRRVPPVDFSSLGLSEAHVEGVGTVMSTPRRSEPLAPRGTPPKNDAGGRRTTGSAQAGSKAAHQLPMNLRSLGKLLSGGGVLGK